MEIFICIWKNGVFTNNSCIYTYLVCIDIDTCIFYNGIKVSKYKFIFSYMKRLEEGKWTIKEYTNSI